MAELTTIPREYQAGLAELLKLVKEGQAEELVSALKGVRPVRSRAALRAALAVKLENLESSTVADIVDTLIALFSVRDSLSQSAPEFADTMINVMNRTGSDDLALSDGTVRDSFGVVFTQILEIESLEVAAKAIVLDYEQENIVHGPLRVLTDVRPIFNSGKTDLTIRGAMITYTLKFNYHDGRSMKEMFAALDAEQVDELINVLERAKSKAESLERWVKGSEIQFLEDE